jgi:hypothetical protein
LTNLLQQRQSWLCCALLVATFFSVLLFSGSNDAWALPPDKNDPVALWSVVVDPQASLLDRLIALENITAGLRRSTQSFLPTATQLVAIQTLAQTPLQTQTFRQRLRAISALVTRRVSRQDLGEYGLGPRLQRAVVDFLVALKGLRGFEPQLSNYLEKPMEGAILREDWSLARAILRLVAEYGEVPDLVDDFAKFYFHFFPEAIRGGLGRLTWGWVLNHCEDHPTRILVFEGLSRSVQSTLNNPLARIWLTRAAMPDVMPLTTLPPVGDSQRLEVAQEQVAYVGYLVTLATYSDETAWGPSAREILEKVLKSGEISALYRATRSKKLLHDLVMVTISGGDTNKALATEVLELFGIERSQITNPDESVIGVTSILITLHHLAALVAVNRVLSPQQLAESFRNVVFYLDHADPRVRWAAEKLLPYPTST